MLLIDDDEAEIGKGQEQRRARADDDPGLACRDRPPGGAPLGPGEIGMPFGRPGAEALLEALEPLARQGDLGQQHQRLMPGAQRCGHGLEIDLGLARAGDAIQQGDAAIGQMGDQALGRRALRR